MPRATLSLRPLPLVALALLSACEDGASPAASAKPSASAKPATTAAATAALPSSSAAAPAATSAEPAEQPPPPAPVVAAGDLTIPDGPVAVQVGAAKVVFKSAILYAPFGIQEVNGKKYFDQKLSLVLSTDEKLDCQNAKYGSDYVQIELGAGPDGTFFAGKEIAKSYFVYAEALRPVLDGNSLYVTAPFTRIKLGAFKTGDASFDLGLSVSLNKQHKDKSVPVRGGGHVKVQICKDRNKEAFDGIVANAKAPAAKAGPVGGKVGKAAFQSKGALAIVAYDKANDVELVESINFYGSAATCEEALKDVFSGGGVQGIGWQALYLPLTAKNRLLGTATPLSLSGSDFKSEAGKFRSTSLNFDGASTGWIRIDEASLDENGTVKGALVADSGPRPPKDADSAGRLDGTFTAKVCKRKR